MPEGPASRAPRALVTPVVDALCTGGLSLFAIGILYLVGPRPLKGHDHGAVFVLGLLLNWPHFIASYRLLYRDRASVAKHRAASLWVPAALAAWCVLGVAFQGRAEIANSLLVVGSVYLARHYTGQTWGMMASFAFLCDTPFSPSERRLVRWSLDLLMVWHGVWAASHTIGFLSPAAAAITVRVLPHLTWLRIAALLVGGAGLIRFARRHRRLPPARVLIPWAAINVWYAAMAEDVTMLFAVQLAHALQYLLFPVRIEMNRRRGDVAAPSRIGALAYVAWTVIGIGVFEGLEPVLRLAFANTGGTGSLPAITASVVISAIGIHHYFIDGALYKLRNPDVRRDLFSHARPEPAQEPPLAASA